MNDTATYILNVLYAIIILASVPIITLGIDSIMNYVRKDKIVDHGKLDVIELLLYVLLLLIAVIIVYIAVKAFIKVESIEFGILTLVSSLLTVSSKYLSSSIKNLIPFSM